jgi:DNA-binding transcriptional LysR family regulator
VNPALELSIFLRVIDLGSFAAVAEETSLTPSGISKIVTRLEDRLGVRLLQRSTRRLVLTQEGETYALRCRDILAALEAAEAEVTAGRGHPKGLIRINTGSAFGKHRLARVLPKFHALYPDISIEISITDRRIDVIADQVDIAIRVGPLENTSLLASRLGEVRRIIVASPAYLKRCGTPRKARDLLSHNCLALTGFTRLAEWPMYEDSNRILLPVKGSIRCDNAELLLDLAIAGVGIIRLGDFLGEEALAQGKLVSLLDDCHDADPTPITALVPPNRQRLPRIRAFLDFLRDNALHRSAAG